MRRAISPRLAMRILLNISLAVPAVTGRRFEADELLAVLDGVAAFDERGADDAVDGRDDLLADAEDVDVAEPVAGSDAGTRAELRAGLEDADRRGGGDRSVRGRRMGAVAVDQVTGSDRAVAPCRPVP